MQRASIILPILFVAGCAAAEMDPSAGLPDAGNPRVDGGVIVIDAGPRDGGTADGGSISPCSLAPPLVHLESNAERLSLGALAISDGRIALAYGSGTASRLRLADEEGALISEVEVSELGDMQPETLAADESGYLLAGLKSGGGTGIALFDASGAQSAADSVASLRPLSSLLQPEGAVVLAMGKAAQMPGPELAQLLRLNAAAAVDETLRLGSVTRSGSSWDVTLGPDGQPLSCGSVFENQGEWLALFRYDGQSVVTSRSSVPLATAPESGAAFGCRIAAAESISTVALAETDGRARLLWMGSDGATLAGPVPFLGNYLDARQYDVAMKGASTAIAFFDSSNGPPRVLARLFASPGGEPMDVRLDDGLGLSDFTANRVRVVADGARYLVAFDAAQPGGSTHLVVRAFTCGQ